MSNPIVHLELAAHDPAASSKFYANVFGWKIERDANQKPRHPFGGVSDSKRYTNIKPFHNLL